MTSYRMKIDGEEHFSGLNLEDTEADAERMLRQWIGHAKAMAGYRFPGVAVTWTRNGQPWEPESK